MPNDYEREANAILADIPWREPDGADALTYTLRNPLPSVSWRKLDTTPDFMTPSDRLRYWLAARLEDLSVGVAP